MPSVRHRHRQSIGHEVDGETYTFPLTRGGCVDGPRPCPWVRCRHHMFGEVCSQGHQYRAYVSGVDGPEEMDPEWSCALDVADRGWITLERVGQALGVTRERVRQIEYRVMQRARENQAHGSAESRTASREFRRLWRLLQEDDVPPIERLGVGVPWALTVPPDEV